MNRRSYLKSTALLIGGSIISFSLFEWYDFKKVFDPNELKLKRVVLAELVETIIPATQTPGAKAALVHDYIIKVIINCNPNFERRRFLAGIESVEKYALNNYSKEFLECTSEEKTAIVQYLADHTGYSHNIFNKISNKLIGEQFYTKLRNLTIEGFCLSKPGATQALAYDYIPGKFEACVPIQNMQKSWATK